MDGQRRRVLGPHRNFIREHGLRRRSNASLTLPPPRFPDKIRQATPAETAPKGRSEHIEII